MAKNAKFKDVYVVVIEGTTTNEFKSMAFEEFMFAVMQAYSTKQVKVSVRKV